MPFDEVLPLIVTIVDLQEHKSILAFLDHLLRKAAEEPLDLEADAIIRAYFKRNPEAAYRITRFAMDLTPLCVAQAPDMLVKRWRWLQLFRDRH